MRVLFLAPTPYFSLRGTPIAVRRVLRYLARKGHEVELLTFPFGVDETPPGVRITRCGATLRAALSLDTVPLGPSWRKALFDFALFVRLALWALRGGLGRRGGFDCIHAVDESVLGCWLLKPLLGVPVIYDMDSSIEEQFERARCGRAMTRLARWVERRMVAAADVVLVVSPGLEERVRRIDPGKSVHLLPDRPPVTAAMISAATGRPPGPLEDVVRPLVLYAGNLGAHQGVEELLRAFELERAGGLRCTLAIAGSPTGAAVPLETIGPGAVFLGELPPEDLAIAYACSDLLASPRLGGSNTPMKIYEYLEAGRLILATRIPAHDALRGHEPVVWADPDVPGLSAGLRTAVADWRSGRRGTRPSGGDPVADDREPVLEEVYAAVATAAGPRKETARR